MSSFAPLPAVEQLAETIFNRQNTDPDCAWHGNRRGEPGAAAPYAPTETTRGYCLALARTELAAETAQAQ